MTNEKCCVCDKPATRNIGHRTFCEEHFASATRDNKTFVQSGIINLGLIAVFTAAVYFLADILPASLVQSNLVLTGLVLAIVPAMLWLFFFYQQDRLEPEPHHYVLGVFFIAMLATDFLWNRVINDVFHLSEWIATNNISALVGNVFIVGFLVQGLVYLVLRLTVYPTAEFDERMDGIVYGTAAGLGIATMLNINFIVDSNGADLGLGVIHVVVTALAQAAFGGVVGYFMGEMKFTDEPAWWMPLGIVIAAVLDGVFEYLLVEVNQAGLQVSPWRGLFFALVVAGATFGALIWLIRRAINHTLAHQPAQSGD
jgi:protease PrsW